MKNSGGAVVGFEADADWWEVELDRVGTLQSWEIELEPSERIGKGKVNLGSAPTILQRAYQIPKMAETKTVRLLNILNS